MKNYLYFLLTCFLLFSCSKESNFNSIIEETEDKSSKTLLSSNFDNDEVSQELEILDIQLDGVEVIDGILKFKDHDSFVNARRELSKYNSESVIAWSQKIGFNSIFTELERISQLEEKEQKKEVNNEGLEDFLEVSEEGLLSFSTMSHVDARIYGKQGIIQVGNFTGTIREKLNIWVKSENQDKLLEVLKSRSVSEDDKDFIIIDKRAFDKSKDWEYEHDCPKDGQWSSNGGVVKNPNLNRRLRTQVEYMILQTPWTSGTFNYTSEFWVYTESWKGKNNRYKTNHYLTIDILTVPFYGIPQGWVISRKNKEIDERTKYGSIYNVVSKIYAKDQEYLINNGERLVETIPGTGFSGTAGSHRGMDGLYQRWDCD